jgi:DNA polymerase III epsilon subunit-like protein
MKQFFIDVETTGMDYKIHEIIDLSYQVYDDGEHRLSAAHYIRPDRWDSIDPEALAYNGYTRNQLLTFQFQSSFLTGLLCNLSILDVPDFKDKYTIIGWRVKFDIDFLREFFRSYNLDKAIFDYYFSADYIDVYQLAMRKAVLNSAWKPKDMHLSTVAEALGIDVFNYQLHTSAGDVKLCRDVYNILINE